MGKGDPPGIDPQYIRLPQCEEEEYVQPNLAKARCRLLMTRTRLVAIAVSIAFIIIMLIYSNLVPLSTEMPLSVMLSTSAPNAKDDNPYSSEIQKMRVKHTKRRIPQCLIIGVRKAGTRALLTFLDLHPQVMTAKEEIHFFDDDENYANGLEWYRKKMPYSFPEDITLEKSPKYFTADEAPWRVYQMNSSIKLLLIVRDPVDRAVSDYLQIRNNKLSRGKTYGSFEEMAILEDGSVNLDYNPLHRSLYVKPMTRWLKYFPLSQFLLISGETLVDDPVTELYRVEKFLGLEHKITHENLYFNETRGFYCIRNETTEKCLAESKGRAHPYVDPLVVRKLRDYYRPYNINFYELVKQEFGWR